MHFDPRAQGTNLSPTHSTRTAGRAVLLALTLAIQLSPIALYAGTHPPDPPPTQIPIVHGTTLAGDSITLPDALHGKIGILVLGFSQHSRDQVTPWGKRLAADYRTAPDVLYFEMPMLAAVPRLLRSMVVHSLKSSVPERAQPRFLPVTEDEAHWRTLAHYSNTSADDAYVLLVDQTGRVLWQTQGAPTDATYTALHHQVEALRSHL